MELKFSWHVDDSLLDGITFQELIDTVICNESKRNIVTIERVFNDLMVMKVTEARFMFWAYYSKIKEELKK